MKHLIKTLILSFLTFPGVIYSQSEPNRIIIANKLDTSFTHLFVAESKYENVRTYYEYNLGNYIINETTRIFDTLNKKLHTNFEVLSQDIPKRYDNLFGYLNISGKPNKKIKKWCKELCMDENAKYLIIIGKKLFHPDSRDAFLNGLDYGMATYNHLEKLVTYFATVKYHVFRTEPPAILDHEYKTGYSLDIPLFDFDLDKPLTEEERKNIPEKHVEFAIDNIELMTSIQIEKILRSIVLDMQQHP